MSLFHFGVGLRSFYVEFKKKKKEYESVFSFYNDVYTVVYCMNLI